MRRVLFLTVLSSPLALIPSGPVRAQVPAAARRTADGRLEVVALPAGGQIKLDGILDEAAWKRGGAATGFVQSEPREGSARHRTDRSLRGV